MIRILHVVNRMGFGGIETFLMNIYRNVDRTKIQFDFAVHTKQKGEYDEEIKMLGGNIYYFPSRRENFLKYYYEWNKFLKNNSANYSAIHMHVSSLTTVLPIKLAEKYKIKNRIIHAHSTMQPGRLHKYLNQYNQRCVLRYVTKLFACSTEAGKYVFGNNSFEIIKNAIRGDKYIFNIEKRKNVREQLQIKDDEYAIVHVGRFSFEKNHQFIIDVFREISKINNNIKLFLIGDGPLKDDMIELVRSYGLKDKIIFLGRRNDVNELLQAMDICVFPSIYEGMPITLIEMQASGLRTIASGNITKEVKVTPLVEFYDINYSAKMWAEKLLENINYERKNMYNDIKTSGYDINSIVDTLINEYMRGK